MVLIRIESLGSALFELNYPTLGHMFRFHFASTEPVQLAPVRLYTVTS